MRQPSAWKQASIFCTDSTELSARELPRKLRTTKTKERQASASRGCDLGEAGVILVQGFEELFHPFQLDVKLLGLLESSARLSGHTTQQKGAYARSSGSIQLIAESRAVGELGSLRVICE